MSSPPLRNFSFVLPHKLAGSAHPGYPRRSPDELARVLRDHGVGAVVSLDTEGLPPDALAEAGIPYLHLAIEDFQPPTPGQIDEFIAFAEENIAANRPVLTHCYMGMGRTGTMIACYLVRQGADPRRAIIDVRKARPGSIETYGQEDAIYAYFRTLSRRTA